MEWLSYWDVVLALAAIPAIGLAAAAAGLAVVVWQRRARQRRLRLELFNQGNARTPYALWVDNPAGQLAFRLTIHGAAHSVPVAGAASPAPPPAASPASAPTGFSLSGVTRWLSQVLSTAGRLLPGQLGASVRGFTAQMHNAEYTAASLGSLAPSLPAGKPAAPTPAASVAPAPAPAPAGRLQTPAVEPGASLVMQLEITPTAGLASPVCAFQVLTQALQAETSAVSAEAVQVEFRPLSALMRFGPWVVIGGAALAGIAACLVYVFGFSGVGF